MLPVYDNVIVEVSNRHVHITQEDFYNLFELYEMVVDRQLSIGNEFAAKHWVTLKNEHGKIERVRVLGPFRGKTQVEALIADKDTLDIVIPQRLSGDHAGTPGITLQGPKGEVTIPEGVIRAKRHVHVNKDDVNAYVKFGMGNYKTVCAVTKEGVLIPDLAVRFISGEPMAGSCYIHLDRDEAESYGIPRRGTNAGMYPYEAQAQYGLYAQKLGSMTFGLAS